MFIRNTNSDKITKIFETQGLFLAMLVVWMHKINLND
jgi:hypothetical protein